MVFMSLHLYQTILTVGTLLGSLPFLFRNNALCMVDDDCPYFMKCCYDGINNYCCTPNKYIKYVPVYVTNK